MRVGIGPRSATRTLLAAAMIGTILASGCVFQPREPMAPSGDNVEWIRPIEPGNVLANMRSAVNAQQETNYSNSLAEGFLFVPLQRDVDAAPPDYFEDFDKERELAAIRKLYTQTTTLQLEWNFNPNEDILEETGNEVKIELDDYQLTVTYTSGDEVLYQGYAVITMRYENSQWQLYLWDESGSDSPEENSWGRLRANLQV